MPKFRKKPIIIEAVQYNGYEEISGTNLVSREVREFLGDDLDYHVLEDGLLIPTLEGDMLVRPSDWLIRGVNDEIYPCKNDIFQKTYERV